MEPHDDLAPHTKDPPWVIVMNNVKHLSIGRWQEIFSRLGISIPENGKHGPCPVCGGKDRFRCDDKEGRGTWICSQCPPNNGSDIAAGDGFDLVRRANGCATMKQAFQTVAEMLGANRSKAPYKERHAAYHRRELNTQCNHTANEDEACKQAAIKAQYIWERSIPACDDHTYLHSKGVHAYSINTVGGDLIIPVRINGEIVSIQCIKPNGTKLFLKNGKVGGGYHFIEGTDAPIIRIYIAEGYATGASVRDATGGCVVIAFNAGNLSKVAKAIRSKYCDTEIIIAGDNDESGAGEAKGKVAAENVNGIFTMPPDTGMDWNDFSRKYGPQSMCMEIERQLSSLRSDIKLGVNILCAENIKIEPINWLWNGWLAGGKLHILAGQAGTGKTTLAMSLAAIISSSGTWPDGAQTSVGSVLIWSGEDDPADSLIPRLLASGANLKRVFFITDMLDNDGVRNFDPSRDMLQLIENALRIPDLRLLIIDPIVSAITGDSHKNAEVRRGLQPIVDMASKVGAAVLGITHFTKGSKGADPTERVTGSLAFGALARLVMCTAKPVEDGGSRRLVRSKSNIGPDGGGFEYDLKREAVAEGIEGQAVQWGTAIDGAAHDLLAEVETPEDGEHTERDDAKEWLKEILAEDPLASKTIERMSKQAGFAWRTVQRARKKCPNIEIKRKGFGKGSKVMWAYIHATKSHTRQTNSVACMEKDGVYGESTPTHSDAI